PYVVENAPLIFSTLVVLLLLVSLLRVLPPLVQPHFRPLLYFIAGFLFVDRVERLTGAGHEVRRLLLLSKAVVSAAAAMFWLRLHALDAGRFMKVLCVILRVAVVTTTVSFFANVLGFAFLARMLMRGTLRSAYLGLALVAAIFVIQGLFEI